MSMDFQIMLTKLCARKSGTVNRVHQLLGSGSYAGEVTEPRTVVVCTRTLFSASEQPSMAHHLEEDFKFVSRELFVLIARTTYRCHINYFPGGLEAMSWIVYCREDEFECRGTSQRT